MKKLLLLSVLLIASSSCEKSKEAIRQDLETKIKDAISKNLIPKEKEYNVKFDTIHIIKIDTLTDLDILRAQESKFYAGEYKDQMALVKLDQEEMNLNIEIGLYESPNMKQVLAAEKQKALDKLYALKEKIKYFDDALAKHPDSITFRAYLVNTTIKATSLKDNTEDESDIPFVVTKDFKIKKDINDFVIK